MEEKRYSYRVWLENRKEGAHLEDKDIVGG
jgi:hypothetical protein